MGLSFLYFATIYRYVCRGELDEVLSPKCAGTTTWQHAMVFMQISIRCEVDWAGREHSFLILSSLSFSVVWSAHAATCMAQLLGLHTPLAYMA